jgi:hypothetical protein
MIPAMTLQTVVTFLKMPVLAISFIYTLFWRQTVSLNGENAETPEQHIFYYSRVGTRGNWFKQMFNSVFALADGGMEDILDEAKTDLKTRVTTKNRFISSVLAEAQPLLECLQHKLVAKGI